MIHVSWVRWLTFVFVVCLPGIFSPILAQDERGGLPEGDIERVKARAELMRDAFMMDHVGTLVVAGEIMDEEGVALEDVEMECRLLTAVRSDDGPVKDVVRKLVGPEFSETYTNGMQLTMTFSKEGYFSESITLSVARDGSRSWGGKKIVDKKALRVVLTEMGETTQLVAYKARLEYHPSGKAKVVDLTRNSGYHRLSLSDIRVVQSWPTNGICAFSGMFPVEVSDGSEPDMHGEEDGPSAALLMFGENDGFHVYDPIAPDRSRVFRAMREAPAEAYQRWISFPSEKRVLYFFCRIGQKYGKGYASIIGRTPQSGTPLRVNATIFLQADGGRNLNAQSYAW